MRSLPMKLYENSPIYFQNLLTSFEGYRLTKIRYGHIYYKYLKQLIEQNSNNVDKMKEHQLREMQKLIKYAFKNSSFYSEFYKEMDLGSIRSLEDFKKLPILEKETLQHNIQSIYTLEENSATISYANGVVGESVKLLNTKEDVQKKMAFLDYFKKQHGVVNLEMKRATFSANRFIPKRQRNKIFWRDNYYTRQRLYSSRHCVEQNAKEFVVNLEEYKPDFIDGTSTAIYEVARYINENKIILSFKPICVFSTIETTLEHYQKEIEKAFDCPFRTQYELALGVPFIAECPKGNLHYHLDSGILETTEQGNTLVTSFHTYGTPLIRYNIGDRFEVLEEKGQCECKSIHPIVKEVKRHQEDYLLSKSKGKFTTLYLSMVSHKYSPCIRKMQFIQDNHNVINLLIEAEENYTNLITEYIDEEMTCIFGNDMRINIRIVEEIPKKSDGNFKLVINNLT